MRPLIDRIFNESQSDAIRQLWSDKDCKDLIERQIGIELFKSEEIIDEMPLTQLMLLTSLADFSSSSQECYDVAEIIIWGVKKEDILPSIIEHRKEELAYRCLLSLGFYKKALVKKWNRHGAPSPDFYREIGAKTFWALGKKEISNHFYQWEGFMSEMFD